MDYIELRVQIGADQEKREVVTAFLAEAGYESFVDEGEFLLSYIAEHHFNIGALDKLIEQLPEPFKFSFEFKKIATQNWNAVWEKNYTPVLIANSVFIRAPFHEKNGHVEYEIIIEPKMSFGTAHHPTTAQIVQLMISQNFKDKEVLDMGCGTSVLAILASMLGAKHIDAVDNDEWAYNNSIENVERNSISNISVYHDDAAFLNKSKKNKYDLIIANINRNILLNDLAIYAQSLKKGGQILMSGFYEQDLEILKNKASGVGLIFDAHIADQKWVAAKWTKN